jgi:hypothetical protein
LKGAPVLWKAFYEERAETRESGAEEGEARFDAHPDCDLEVWDGRDGADAKFVDRVNAYERCEGGTILVISPVLREEKRYETYKAPNTKIAIKTRLSMGCSLKSPLVAHTGRSSRIKFVPAFVPRKA